MLPSGDLLVELATPTCFGSRAILNITTLKWNSCASIVFCFALGMTSGSLIASCTPGSTTLVCHLVLRYTKLGALPDTLPSTIFFHMNLCWFLMRWLPSLYWATVGSSSVVRYSMTELCWYCHWVLACHRSDRLMCLILPYFLGRRAVCFVGSVDSGGHRPSSNGIVKGSHVLYLRVLKAHKSCLLPYLVVLMETTVISCCGCPYSELGF